jgi:hypothetical protein
MFAIFCNAQHIPHSSCSKNFPEQFILQKYDHHLLEQILKVKKKLQNGENAIYVSHNREAFSQSVLRFWISQLQTKPESPLFVAILLYAVYLLHRVDWHSVRTLYLSLFSFYQITGKFLLLVRILLLNLSVSYTCGKVSSTWKYFITKPFYRQPQACRRQKS